MNTYWSSLDKTTAHTCCSLLHRQDVKGAQELQRLYMRLFNNNTFLISLLMTSFTHEKGHKQKH